MMSVPFQSTPKTARSLTPLSSVHLTPLATDFVNYYPYACGQFQLGYDVIISKMIQSEFVGPSVISKAKKVRIPNNPMRANISRMDLVAETEGHEPTNHGLFGTNPVMKITAICNTSDRITHLKFERTQWVIPQKMFIILGLFIRFHPHLITLSIKTKIDQSVIYEISQLIKMSNIVELHLDGCFVKEANYHLLLSDSCGLKILSLARCTLTDTVLKTITDKLDHLDPASKSLISLNISSNMITDVGAVYIGEVLRSNRHLAHLNISGNLITDDGMTLILAALLEFQVQDEEFIAARGRRYEYLKSRKDMINDLVVQMNDEELDKLARKTTKRSSKNKVMSAQNLVFPSDFIKRVHDRAEVQADLNIGKFLDPFYPLHSRDGEVYGYGNNTLQSLNVAYNNITVLSARKILEVLEYQRTLNRKPRGLVNLNLEGNAFPVICPELSQINSLLEVAVIDSRTRSLSISTKKRSKSYSSIKF